MSPKTIERLVSIWKCKKCGVPDLIGRDQVWRSNGTITARADKKFRMAILEAKMIRHLLWELGNFIGGNYNQIIMEGKRKQVVHYMDGLLGGAVGVLTKSWTGSKRVYEEIKKTGQVLGYGHTTIEGYRKKEFLLGRVTNPYYPALFAGDVAGTFESVEQVPCKVEWRGDFNQITFRAERTDEENPMEEMLLFKEERILPGEHIYETCGCGLPTELKRFKWNLNTGMIWDDLSSKRVFLMGLNDLNAVFTELENAIGEKIPEMIWKANKKYGAVQAKEGVFSDYKGFLDYLPITGLGLAEILEEQDDLVKIRIRNPYNPDMIGGRIEGIFEYSTYGNQSVKMREEPGCADITVEIGY